MLAYFEDSSKPTYLHRCMHVCKCIFNENICGGEETGIQPNVSLFKNYCFLCCKFFPSSSVDLTYQKLISTDNYIS